MAQALSQHHLSRTIKVRVGFTAVRERVPGRRYPIVARL
jgi:hypothetical protein